MSKTYVFTYGTLMKDRRNHGYMKDAIYIADGELDGYEMYDLGTYPGIIEGSGTVFGESDTTERLTLSLSDIEE